MRLSLPLLAVGLSLSCAVHDAAVAQGRPRVEVFRDSDYRGDRRVLDGEVRDFNSIGFNDRISSIRVDSGTWEFCEDANFRGRCVTVDRDERDLAGSSLDDRFSSARPVADRRGDVRGDVRGGRGDDRDFGGRGDNRDFGGRGNAGNGNARNGNDGGASVILYADVGFSGASREAGESRDFRNLDFNDTVSSIRIRSGAWEFCSDADFRGRCMTFDRDVPSLVPFGFNDTISSMRRVR
jgi:hypothetical protein